MAVIAVGSPTPLLAQAPTIQHDAVACIVAGKYPKLRACFSSEVVRAFAYFHAEGVREWYHVEMVPDVGCHAGVLPRPSRKLVNKRIEYYLEVASRNVQTGRTGEYRPLVVRQAQECKKNALVAPISPTGPAAVFPALPVGFSLGGGVSTAAVAVAGAGVGFGTTIAIRGTGDEAVPPPPPTPPPTPAPIPTPTPTPTPAPVLPLDVSCQADPRSGQVPLRVRFDAFAAGGTGDYAFFWEFGDGATSTQVHPSHTYESPGEFRAVVTVTSGALVRQCERTITVTRPPPPAPPPSSPSPSPSPTLTFTCSEDESRGTSSVKINPPDTTCSADSSETLTETYSPGTKVTMTTSDDGDYLFACWGGACPASGNKTPSDGATCMLTMDSDKSASLTFQNCPCGSPLPCATLTFTATEQEACSLKFNIDPPGTDCTASVEGATCRETYPAGRVVRITSPSAEAARGCADDICWSGDCDLTPDTLGSVCTLTMATDQVAGATLLQDSFCPDAVGPPVRLSWSIELDVPGAIGQAVVDGQMVVAASGQRVHQQTAHRGDGEIAVAAHLVKAGGKPGTWRFEAEQGEAIEPGSLRVLQGDVALLTPTAVVFRLKGNAGERVAFSYRLRR